MELEVNGSISICEPSLRLNISPIAFGTVMIKLLPDLRTFTTLPIISLYFILNYFSIILEYHMISFFFERDKFLLNKVFKSSTGYILYIRSPPGAFFNL